MTDLPHFDLPFRFGPQAAVVEQDSVEEIAECVLAILLCPQGYRVELPEFGVDDPTFSVPDVDLEAVRAAITTWEPRADAVLSQAPDSLDELIRRVQVLVQVRTEE